MTDDFEWTADEGVAPVSGPLDDDPEPDDDDEPEYDEELDP